MIGEKGELLWGSSYLQEPEKGGGCEAKYFDY